MDNVNLGMNVFCGPAVLSIFSGADTDTCADAITKINGRHTITGVNSSDLIKAGQSLGLEFEENKAFEGRSLFWSASALVNFPGQYLITIPRHYIAIEVTRDRQISICDNHTKEPIDLQNSARLSQKVERVWKVTKVRDYIVPTLKSMKWETIESGTKILINKIHYYSDETFKLYQMGSFEAPLDKKSYQDIAFSIMKLGE